MIPDSPGRAVVINLDYMNLQGDLCRMLWLLVERAMREAGFSQDNRIFVSDEPDVPQRARAAMKALEPTFQSLGVSQLEAVREFYCYDLATRVDLNAVDSTEVVEIFD